MYVLVYKVIYVTVVLQIFVKRAGEAAQLLWKMCLTKGRQWEAGGQKGGEKTSAALAEVVKPVTCEHSSAESS